MNCCNSCKYISYVWCKFLAEENFDELVFAWKLTGKKLTNALRNCVSILREILIDEENFNELAAIHQICQNFPPSKNYDIRMIASAFVVIVTVFLYVCIVNLCVYCCCTRRTAMPNPLSLNIRSINQLINQCD